MISAKIETHDILISFINFPNKKICKTGQYVMGSNFSQNRSIVVVKICLLWSTPYNQKTGSEADSLIKFHSIASLVINSSKNS